MDKDAPNASVSEQELRILIKALTKSVEYIHKRYLILAVIAGLVIGIGIGVLVANIAGMGQRLPDTAALLNRSDQALLELRQLRSDVNSLSAAKAGDGDAKSAAAEKETPAQPEKTEAVQNVPAATKPSVVKVHIHFARPEDKKTAEALSDFLRKKGYTSIDTEEIRHGWRDIRYFHEGDREQALLLQKQFTEFVKDRAAQEVNLKIKDLSKRYPRAKRGSIEVWVYF
ncbi:MAG TPA: hypothetical protein VLZ07_11005 [Syntrophales bacterium]|nr:hypothetical protein [Syntrophales bacterium]